MKNKIYTLLIIAFFTCSIHASQECDSDLYEATYSINLAEEVRSIMRFRYCDPEERVCPRKDSNGAVNPLGKDPTFLSLNNERGQTCAEAKLKKLSDDRRWIFEYQDIKNKSRK